MRLPPGRQGSLLLVEQVLQLLEPDEYRVDVLGGRVLRVAFEERLVGIEVVRGGRHSVVAGRAVHVHVTRLELVDLRVEVGDEKLRVRMRLGAAVVVVAEVAERSDESARAGKSAVTDSSRPRRRRRSATSGNAAGLRAYSAHARPVSS